MRNVESYFCVMDLIALLHKAKKKKIKSENERVKKKSDEMLHIAYINLFTLCKLFFLQSHTRICITDFLAIQ